MTRSVPVRVKIAVCSTISLAVPSPNRPPTCEYSPSLFSRTIHMSMPWRAIASLTGGVTPGSSRTGRSEMYCWNWRRIGISSPHREM